MKRKVNPWTLAYVGIFQFILRILILIVQYFINGTFNIGVLIGSFIATVLLVLANIVYIRQKKDNTPIIVENVDWGGHWRVIMGYDSMGTKHTGDDVLFMADPFDTSDHLQDGYNILSAERFFYMWFDSQLFSKKD